MKIFTTSQVAELDQYTITNEPIQAIDLMERASLQLAHWIAARFDAGKRIAVFAGPGNNGGDALAVSRMLAARNFKADVFIPDFGQKRAECFLINLDRLKEQGEVKISMWNTDESLPDLFDYDFIIDGLFGSGLTRPLAGFPAQLVQHMNQSGLPIIAIDIPSGLMGEDNRKNNVKNIVKASFTLTFQYPKLSFFLKENEMFTGKWEILPIGLHPAGVDMIKTPWYYSDLKTMVSILKPREKFSHKGTFGHALIVAGSIGKTGAAILAAKGCLRSGVGLLTVHLPHSGNQIMQTALPEAMVSIDESENVISNIPLLTNYKAIGIGPGIGKADETRIALQLLLTHYHHPMVIDADALNLLSENPHMVKLIPPGSVLTPHPVEFERLAGHTESDFDRIQLAQRFAQIHHIILILKGANTAIALPDGRCWFNSTGNPGMATAGSGDVLTGILTGLLTQGYTPEETAILGVYLHGLAGDLAVEGSSEEAILAGDIADHLGMAYTFLKSDPNFGKAKKKNQF
jgi:hydroxyethylthiazole kinase-like uncharacterized protein yjeF